MRDTPLLIAVLTMFIFIAVVSLYFGTRIGPVTDAAECRSEALRDIVAEYAEETKL